MREPKVYPSGDQALTLQFGNAVDPVINDQVRALAEAITHKKIPEYWNWFRLSALLLCTMIL